MEISTNYDLPSSISINGLVFLYYFSSKKGLNYTEIIYKSQRKGTRGYFSYQNCKIIKWISLLNQYI
jgi:hypothetical protein